MFGFPFITSLVVLVVALSVTSLAFHKGMKKRQQEK